MHPYYDLLPSYVSRESVDRERDEFVARVRETLTLLRAPGVVPLQKRHLRAVETLFKLKHALPVALHRELIEALVDHLWARDAADIVDVNIEVRATNTLRLLLSKWKSKQPPSERRALAIDWRLAKRALDRVCFSAPGRARLANPTTLQLLASSMVKSVEKARPAFGLGEQTSFVAQLWSEFGTQINDVKSNRCFQALGFFTLLFNIPVDANDREWQAIEALIPQWLHSWALITRCADWDGHWFKLFSRVAKRFPVKTAEALSGAYPFIFAKVHSLLDLPSDLGSPFKNNARPSAYSVLDGSKRYDQFAMRLCAYLLGNPSGASGAGANQFVVDILTTVKPFFHPSNASPVAGSLINTVYFLINSIGSRLGVEKATGTILEVESCHDIFDGLLQLSFYGIYSKNRSVASKCMYVIKNLVCIDPAHCAKPVLDEMVKALDPRALSQSHLAPAAISSLSVFLYHLMCGQNPEGPGLLFSTYLSSLLRLTLPGIDPNDETKTMTTIRFYFHVLSWLPLVNDVEKKGGDGVMKRTELSTELFKEMEKNLYTPVVPNGPDIDRKLWELGSFLEEWTLALVDRCLDFIRTRANTQKHDSGAKPDTSHGSGHREDHAVLEVLNMMSLLYSQMSPAIYSQAVRKTISFVSNSFFTSDFGGKAISTLVFNSIQGNIRDAAPQFARLALEKLVKADSLMKNEKVWYLRILNGAVRANDSSGEALLGLRTEIRSAVAQYLLKEDDKEVYEAAGEVLEHLLHALVGVYPLDFRSLPQTEWDAATNESASMFQFLGTAISWKRVAIQWHEPNERELLFAHELLQDHLLSTIDALEQLRASKDVTVRQWVPHLKRVYVGVRGARNIFVDATGGSGALQAGSLPLLSRAFSANNEMLESYVSLKSRVLTSTHQFVDHWKVNGHKGVTENQVWTVMLKTIKQLLVWRGSHIGGHRSKEKQNMYIKVMTSDVASKELSKSRRHDQDPRDVVPLSSRNEMIERVLFFYSKRKVQEHFETAQFVLSDDPAATNIRTQYEALLLDVEDLSRHAYEEVRNSANGVMRESYEIFTKWIYSRISDNLDILEGKVVDKDGTVKEETILGALEFLRRQLVLAYLWKSRGVLLERALKAVLGSTSTVIKKLESEASKAKVGLQIQVFFLTLLGNWRYVREEASTRLIDALLASEPSTTEHWKQQLMHLVCFYPLLQPDELPLPSRLWSLILRQLQHEVLPVRQVAVLLLSQLVRLEKWKFTSTNSRDEEVMALLFSDATLEAIIKTMVENHRNTHRFSASADGQHANSAPTDWSFGVNEVIRNLSNAANSYPKPPPLSSIRLLNQTSDAFSSIQLIHVRLVQRLVQLNPRAIFQGVVFPALEKLTDAIDSKVSDEDRQASLSTLGEWVAGMLRGALKLPAGADDLATSAVTSVTELMKKVLPHVNLALVEPWTQVLYFTSRPSNSRPEGLNASRLQVLAEHLSAELEQSFARATAEDYANQVKWLSLIEPLLVHILGSSGARLAQLQSTLRGSVVGVIERHALAHRYKMVRDRVAKTLYVVDVTDDAAPESRATNSVLQKLVTLAQVESSTSISSVDGDGESEDALSAKETAMQWLTCADRHGDTNDFARVMKHLFPVAFLTQNHSKVEIALLAKNTTNAISLSLRLYAPPSDEASSGLLNDLLLMLELFGAHPLWKTRAAVLRFLTLFTFYHWIFLSFEQQERVQKIIMTFLADEQREVQDMAKYALRSLVHIQRTAVVEALSRQLSEQAQDSRVKHPKLVRRLQKQEKEQPDDTDEIERTKSRIKANEKKMATSILGASAIVLAFPHSVPLFVPPLFEEMGRYLFIKLATPTVSYLEKSVKDTLLEFKRAHQDNWLEVKTNLTQAQRDVFEDVGISPSYYT